MAGRRVKLTKLPRVRKVALRTPGDQKGKAWTLGWKPPTRNYYGHTAWGRKRVDINLESKLRDIIATVVHEGTHVALGNEFYEDPIERAEHNITELLFPLLGSFTASID